MSSNLTHAVHPVSSCPEASLHRLPAVLLAAILATPGVAAAQHRPACTDPVAPATLDPTTHRTSCITVAPGVTLEVLDWGGSGPTLLFLSGLGDSGHEFDDFAPRFTDHYHVIGLTRRGFGRSSDSPSGYDLPTLGEDILHVLDSLHLSSVALIGHSFAGDEMSWFAAHWPDRVNHLVYLDAAHDRTSLAALLSGVKFPPESPMTAADSTNAGTVRTYIAAKTMGVVLPLGWFQSLAGFDASGRYRGWLTPDSMVFVFLSGTRAPDYRHITTPTLAIYAVPEKPEAMFPAYAEMSPVDRALADSATATFRAWGQVQIDKLRAELAGARILPILNARHYVFITNEAEVEEAMRRFLR